MEEGLDDIEVKGTEWKKIIEDYYGTLRKELDLANEAIPKMEQEVELTGEKCPECGRDLAIKHGRFGSFIACTGYPECKYTKPIVKKITYIYLPIFTVCLGIMVGSLSSTIFIGGIMFVTILIGGIGIKELIIPGLAAVGILAACIGINAASSKPSDQKPFPHLESAIRRVTSDKTENIFEILKTSPRGSDEFQQALDKVKQPVSAKIAIQEGGLLGKGPGRSTQRYVVPIMFEDYMFSFIVEEYGLLGGIFVIILYISLLARGSIIARNCDNHFAKTAVAGLVILITGQAMMHIMINCDLGPLTGQTLPLVSHGNKVFLADPANATVTRPVTLAGGKDGSDNYKSAFITGLHPNYDWRYELVFDVPEFKSNQAWLLCHRLNSSNSGGSLLHFIVRSSTDKRLRFGYGASHSIYSSSAISADVKYRATINRNVFTVSNLNDNVNFCTVNLTASSANYATGYNLWFGASSGANGKDYNTGTGDLCSFARVYSFKAWNGSGEQVGDFRPMVTNGVAAIIGRTWTRYTRLNRDGYAAIKAETWRTGAQGAAVGDAGNAYSYKITYADTTPLERDFGFKPDTPLREGLRRFARWYKEYYKV